MTLKKRLLGGTQPKFLFLVFVLLSCVLRFWNVWKALLLGLILHGLFFLYPTYLPFRASCIAFFAWVCHPFLLHLLSSLQAFERMLGIALPFLMHICRICFLFLFMSFTITLAPIYVCPFSFMPFLDVMLCW